MSISKHLKFSQKTSVNLCTNITHINYEKNFQCVHIHSDYFFTNDKQTLVRTGWIFHLGMITDQW